MQTIAINENNDIYIDSSGNLAIKKDLEAMGDIFINKTETNQGELLYNTEKGIDFFNTIFSSPCYVDLFQSQVLNEIENTDSTQYTQNWKEETSETTYKYSVEIITDYGVVTLNG